LTAEEKLRLVKPEKLEALADMFGKKYPERPRKTEKADRPQSAFDKAVGEIGSHTDTKKQDSIPTTWSGKGGKRKNVSGKKGGK
jgi:hypothetical protein